MMYAVYMMADGTLFSVTNDASVLDADLASNGMAVKQLDITPYDAGGAWDKTNLVFLPREGGD